MNPIEGAPGHRPGMAGAQAWLLPREDKGV